ncbi:MAG TPA: hypothetical protein DDW22_01635 [Prevotellaceae bacterium]|nr:hypothetical protein [Prevotellaceae bacterium]
MKITKNDVFYAIKIYGKKQVFLFACAAHIPLRGIMGTRHHQAYGMERIQKATYRKRTFGVHAPPIREDKIKEKDLNHSAEYMQDSDFGEDWCWCHSMNGEFVGPYAIGIDNYAYEIDNSTRKKRVAFACHSQ